MLNSLVNTISDQILVPALNAVTLAAIAYAGMWLRRRAQGTKHRNIQKYLEGIENIAYLTVQASNQTIVDELKKNGEWNKDRAQELKNKAIANVIRQIKPSVQKMIENAGIDITNYIANSVEAAVREDKKQ
jgi:polyhydroxyalkanoate synthesis regulator phasin